MAWTEIRRASRHAWAVRRDDGAIAVIAALLLVVLLGFGALAVDVGSFYWTKRRLQAATDAAALAATYALPTPTPATDPTSWATDYLVRNGFGAGQLVSVQTGTYCPETTLAPAARFIVGATDCAGFPGFGTGPNAVRVQTRIQAPLYLGKALAGGADGPQIGATATAAQISQAGFSAGTGLLSVNAGLINAVLGGLLGGSITLDAVSYHALLTTNISALGFFQALATNIGVSAGNYGSLLQSTVSVQQVLGAAIDALNQPGSVATLALQSLQAQIVGSPDLALSSLFNLGIWQGLGIGAANPPPALQAALNVFQLATLSAQLANGAHALTIPASTLGIPGLADLSAIATAIEPPITPPFVFGPVGMEVHTAQVRLQLGLQLLNALSLGGLLGTAPVSLPIYIEIADGDARLSAISCGTNPATDAQVTISAQPAAARVFVGTIDPTAMTNFLTRPGVAPAALVNLAGLLQITGTAEVDLGSGSATPLVFTQSDIAAGSVKTVSSTGMLSNLMQVLGSKLVLHVTLLGAGLSTTPITTSLTTLLQPVFAGLDPLVDGLLTALGIRLGYLDITATGVRCGAPVLVD